MIRLMLSVAASSLALSTAIAQEAPAIPAPSKQARFASYLPVADRAPAALPTGRSSAPDEAPKERVSGYASEKPQAYTQPVGQTVYTSRAYEEAPAEPTSSSTTYEGRSGSRIDTMRTMLRGGRAEVRVGWDSVHSDRDNGPESGQSALYGLSVGYDHDIGNMFVGGYLGIDWSSAQLDNTVIIAGTPSTQYQISAEGKNDLELGIRAGFWTNQNVNVYGLLAWTKYSQDITQTNVTNGGSVTRSVDQDGIRLGAGSEVMLPRGLYGKAEYRYSDYGDDPAIPGNDLDRHQIVTGVGVRF